MALVLRKAVLPKNASFLKCLKGRPIATASNKKNTAPISSAVLCRSQKSRIQPLGSLNVKAKHLVSLEKERGLRKAAPVRFCMSCPNLIPESRLRPRLRPRHFSPPRTRPIFNDFVHLRTQHKAIRAAIIFSDLLPKTRVSARAYSKCACNCPCPAPCGPYGCPGGCGCLPPPCNQPPRCLQYITGYYYYPYGTWFCGPYHVSGTCYPVGASGPCAPCGPCTPGPCVKCCAPACVCPAAAAAMAPPVASNPANQMPTQAPMPTPMGNPINSPINNPFNPPKDPVSQPRPGISKFFPGAAANPNIRSESKPKRPQTFKTMSFWPFSTEISKSNNTQSRAYSNLSHHPRSVQDKSTMWTDSCLKTDFETKQKGNRSPIRHKRHRYICQMCSLSDKPKSYLTSELWDGPNVSSGAYDSFPIPNRKRPVPKPRVDLAFKAYDL